MNRHVIRQARRRQLELVRTWAAALLTALTIGFGLGHANAQDTTGNVVTSCGTVPLQYAPGANRPMTVDINGNLCSTGNSIGAGAGNAGYVSNATPVTSSATGTTGGVSVAIPAAAGKFSYICGFAISFLENATGATTSGPFSVAGTQATLNYQQGNVAANGSVTLQQSFSPCLPSSALNTQISVNTTANAQAAAVDVNAWGFQQ